MTGPTTLDEELLLAARDALRITLLAMSERAEAYERCRRTLEELEARCEEMEQGKK